MPVKKKKDDFVEIDVVGHRKSEPKVVTKVSAKSKDFPKDSGKDIGSKISALKKLTEQIKLEKEDEKRKAGSPLKHKAADSGKAQELKDMPSEGSRVFQGEVLKTNVDRLYDLVKLKSIIRVRTASKALHISYDMVEEWARVLEDKKMITLHYPTFGEPIIILKKFRTGKVKKKKLRTARKPNRFAFLFNLLIIVVFVLVVASMMGFHIPFISSLVSGDPLSILYVVLALVIIISAAFMARALLRKRSAPKREVKKDEKSK